MATTYKLIASTTLGANAATIDFTSIPSTFDDLVMLATLRHNRVSTLGNYKIEFNGATTGHSARMLFGGGSDGVGSSAPTSILGMASASTGTSNTFSSSEIYIPNYANTTSNKSVSLTSVQENNTTQAYMYAVAGLWASTAAITSIKLTPTNGTLFLTGCTAYLYGITKA